MASEVLLETEVTKGGGFSGNGFDFTCEKKNKDEGLLESNTILQDKW